MERHDEPAPLSAFLEREEAAGPGDCEALLEQARTLLEEAYVHLPVIQASGIDPIDRLDALRRQRPRTRLQLYRELLALFSRLGDRHTRCSLPEPFASRIAFLPFRVGEFFERGERYLTVLQAGIDELARGDLLLSWNGLSVMEVLERHMAWQHGANPQAKHAMAVQTLTFRPLAMLPPPQEEEVVLEYLSAAGSRRTVRLSWRVAPASWLVRHFAPFEKAADGETVTAEGIRARRVETSHGTFGCIRLDSLHGRPETFLDSFVRTLESMPREGLILDVRGCEEGIVQLGERLLQLFTPRRIQPEPFQFRVTRLILNLVRSSTALADWRAAVERAADQGQTYSESQPLTPEEEANGVGQKYHGPVVLLASALTYSTAEMLAAGFQDHRIGPVVGTAPCTGGGGASPWPQNILFKLSRNEALRPLSDAPAFRIAVRRCHRVHAMSGVPIEGAGVIPNVLHLPTKGDVLNNDVTLMEEAGKVLATMM